jgi:universal stress protein A
MSAIRRRKERAMKSILVPIDFSPVTRSVVAWAASLARDRGANLILLHVQEPSADALVGEMYLPLPIVENPVLREALAKVQPDDQSVRHEHQLLIGAPPDQILKLAADRKVELIVMGSHGRGWLGRLLMGSVAEHVMRHAPCPVLVIKEPHGAPSEAVARQAATAPR